MNSDSEFEKRLNELRRKAEARVSDSYGEAAPESGDEARRLLHDLRVHQIELEIQNEELRESQQALERSRDRYLELYHNAPVGYVVTDSAGMILQVNKTFGHMLGLEIAGMQHQPLSNMIYADDHELFYSRFRTFYKNPTGKRLEIRMARKDGDIVFTSLEGRRTAWPGKPAHGSAPSHQLLITINDISRQKKIEQAIVRAKIQWEQTFDAVPDLIAIINEKSEILRVNKALADRLDKTPQECVGKKCYEVLHHNQQPPEDCPHRRFLAGGQSCTTEAFSRRLNGYFITTVSPFQSDDQKARWCIHISRDITQRRKAESEVFKLRNLESIGYLAGGIAHDFNNILTAQTGNIELAKIYRNDKDKVNAYLDVALEMTETAKELAGRLLTFAEGGHPFGQPLILDRLIEGTLKMALGGTNVTGDLQLCGSLTPVIVDENQIRSALRNIIENAKEAMPHGGTLRIATREVDVLAENKDQMTPGRYMQIEIGDRGPGISADNLEKLFDPYFTTKAMGSQKGVGLGLTISHSIIRRHGGYIAVSCPEGQGTTVTVHLPLESQSTDSGLSEGNAAPVNGVLRPRFLIMDDEKVICDVVGKMLARMNCDADFAFDGEAAIDLYERSVRSGNLYAGLFLDMTIPGGNGAVAVIKKILKINPEAKAVVYSGYTTDPVFTDFRAYGFAAALKKPFQFEELKSIALRLLPHHGNQIQAVNQAVNQAVK
jgi:PAS domain S-box-containing protein